MKPSVIELLFKAVIVLKQTDAEDEEVAAVLAAHLPPEEYQRLRAIRAVDLLNEVTIGDLIDLTKPVSEQPAATPADPTPELPPRTTDATA